MAPVLFFRYTILTMNHNSLILHLSLITGIGPATIQSIIAKQSSVDSLDRLYDLSTHEFMQLFGVSARTAQLLVAGLVDKRLLEAELELIARHNVTLITMLDDSYPQLLAQIHLPPAVLYVQGRLSGGDYSVACVGSRAAGAYAKRVVHAIVPELVNRGCSIISGGAQGVDAFAHQTALEHGGHTVAVLGSGLLRPYPSTNRRLFSLIVERGGALVSGFPLTMAPAPGNFPARNRIIAGLAQSTVVVQAAAQSGALITARFALEQGRDVYAVPGMFDDPLSAGCHELIKQGATLLSSVADMQHLPVADHDTVVETTDNALEGEHGLVLRICREPASIDEIMNQTQLSMTDSLRLLFDLQLDGKITQNPAGLWERL